MKRNLRLLIAALGILSLFAPAAFAGSFTEDFSSGTLNPALTVSSSTGFSFTISGGQGQAAREAGAGAGEVSVSTTFAAVGDFIATVRAGRTSLGTVAPAALGMLLQSTQGWEEGYANIFFSGDTQLIAKISVGAAFSTRTLAQSTANAVFRIRRTGNVLALDYDAGAGFQPLIGITNPAVTLPLAVSLFLNEQSSGTTARSGWFDDLTVTADRLFTPIPNFTATNAPAAFRVSWPSLPGDKYQLEYQANPAATPWLTDGGAVTAAGATLTQTNWVAGHGLRFYRVGQLSTPVSGFAISSLAPLAERLTWPSVTNNQYQLEIRSEATGGAWVPQGAPQPGTGAIMSFTNWLTETPPRTYRVVELP